MKKMKSSSAKATEDKVEKIILGLVIVLGLSFCAAGSVSAIAYSEIETLPEIISEVTSEGNLSYGMRSEVIRELQQILSRDSSIYPEKLTTGYFGLLTQQAVKRFQEKKGFLQTGIVNKHLKGLIWDTTPAPLPQISPTCTNICMQKGYNYGVCRTVCRTLKGEVDMGHTSDCKPPTTIPAMPLDIHCCCGNKDGGDSGNCTDSDGGINKYVKGKTCQPSRWGGIIDQDNPVSGITSSITKLFCKTDYCMTVKTPGGGTYLQEYYCENGTMMSKSIKCENGCKNGACLRVEIPPIPWQPYCDAIGSKSEGWYQHGKLIRWENCDGCVAECKAIGSKSEGWYSSCDNKLIKYANCEESTMTVLSPNGGERLVEGGGTYKITWELNKPAISSIDKIGIYLVDYSRDGIVCSSQGCEPWKRVIAWDLPAYPSEHLWSTSAPFWGAGLPPFLEEQYELMQDKSMKLGDKYKIRIGRMINPQMDFGFYDESDNYFSIVKMGDVSCRDENYPCSIEGIPCCPGLKSSALYGDPNGDCSTIANCGTICIPCGNGVCDANEGICNCPEDCEEGACTKEEVPWHPHDPACCPGLKLVPSCIGACPISAPSYCINCGDGVCKEHESRLNCPQDCKTVNVQPVINMIRQAIEKLNSAMRLLFDLSPYTTSTSGGGSGSYAE